MWFKCGFCGSRFDAPPSQKRRYCSSKCYVKDYKEKGKFGRPHSLESRKKIIKNHWSKKMSSHRKGLSLEEEYSSERAKEIREKISKASKARWRNPAFSNKVLKHLHAKPNKLESKVLKIITTHRLPFEYVGDGSFLIENVNPDFIHSKGQKIAIEVFGRAFHDPTYKHKIKEIPLHQTQRGRDKIFMRNGWKCIFLWSHKLRNKDADEIILNEIKRGLM